MEKKIIIKDSDFESVFRNMSSVHVLPLLLELSKEKIGSLIGFQLWHVNKNELISEYFIVDSILENPPYNDPFDKLSTYFSTIRKKTDLFKVEGIQEIIRLESFQTEDKIFAVFATALFPEFFMFLTMSDNEPKEAETAHKTEEGIKQIACLLRNAVVQNSFDRMKFYESIFDRSSEAFLVIDDKFKIQFANQKASQIFDLKLDKLLDESFIGLSRDFKYENMPFSELLENGLISNFDRTFEIIYEKQKGVRLEFEIVLSKEEAGFIIVRISEVTAHKTTLNQLIEDRQKAEENDRLKTAFLANMSHEIRTPLNSIIGFSDLLLDDDSDWAERRQFVQMIKSAGGTLLQLIDDIIDISKIEAGQIKISKSNVNVNVILDELLIAFTNEKNKRNKDHVKLSLKKPYIKSDFELKTDPYRFKQILTNLLSNALKFVDDGFVEFGYAGIEQDFVQFFVRDSGIGIQRDKLHLVFQRFGQIENTARRNHEGTGLGLSITKQLVELLGGKIWFDSEYLKGTTFYFTLPLSKEATVFKSKSEYKPYINSTFNWSDKLFLIVDDVEANFLFYKAILKHTGALLLWAKNGIEAVKICRNNNSVNLVLMDLQMPQLSGLDATKQIKAFSNSLPIIAQTAFADIEGREKALAAGCDDYITKPVNQAELISLIQKMLNP